MAFCSNCGREIMDESLGCPICSLMEGAFIQSPEAETKETEEKAEKVDSFTVEDENGTSQRFERAEDGERKWGKYESNTGTTSTVNPKKEQAIPTALKVVIIIAIIMVGGIGQIAGLIAGVVMLKSPIEDNRKFGKVLVILSGVLLGFWLICCVFSTAFQAMAVSVGTIMRMVG